MAKNVLENADFELVVLFEAEDDCKVTWFRNNQLVEPRDDCIIKTEKGKSSVYVSDTNKSKIGKYEVVIESKDKTIKAACSVKLTKSFDEGQVQPPEFIRPLYPKEIRLGDILLMEAEVISSPCASFQWFINTKEVTSHAKENKLNNIYVTNRENVSCLCIENITEDLIGIITCRAENFAGSVSCSTSLILLGEENISELLGQSPKFVMPLESATIMDGEPINLTCQVTGIPWPKIQWYHDDKCIQKARDITFARQESGLCGVCIKEAFPEMSGKYKCVATNSFGSSSTECIVNVEGSRLVPVSINIS